MNNAVIQTLRGDEWEIDSKLVLREEKIYVPRDKVLRLEIIQLYHNILLAEYRGKQKTTKLVTRNYWWLGMIRDIEKYVKKYNLYQKISSRETNSK